MTNHLLEVDQPVEVGLVALVDKCQVFEDQRDEGNQGRGHLERVLDSEEDSLTLATSAR